MLALAAGETAEILLAVEILAGELVVEVEAVPRGGAGVEVSLSGEGWSEARARLQDAAVRLAARGTVARTNLVLSLRARAGTEAAGVLWRDIRVTAHGRDVRTSLYPGSGDVDACPARELPALRPALEEFMVEWDWRMQDGIGAARQAATFAEAASRAIERGQALIQDLEVRGLHQAVNQTRWQLLRDERQRMAASGSRDEGAWEALWRQVHQARRQIALANPLLVGRPLAFVKQAPGVFSHQLTQYYGSCARAGGGVFVLEAPGRSMKARSLTAGRFPSGSYQHLDLSPDGKRLLFSYCAVASTPRNREEHLDRFYHIYEMALDGGGLRQLSDGPFDDFAPRYRPGGGVVFISTRRGGFHRCGRGPCAVYTLCIAGADGSEARPVSWHETHEWDPAVMPDGRILYTRWDYVDRHAVHYQQLWSARSDGSGARIFYGNNTLSPVGIWEAVPVPGSHRVMATAGAHHAMTAGSIVLIDPDREPDGPEPLTRLTPDALFPESEAPVAMKPSGAWSAPVGVVAPPPQPPEAARWPGHCYRSPFPLAETHFLAAYSYDALIGEPTWNRANMFGLYLVDAFGNKELLHRDLNISSQWPVLLQARPLPAPVTAALDPTLEKQGLCFLQDVHQSWPALPREPIARLRIVQVLPKSTPHANTPMVGIPHASPGRQVLGTVPVEPDGSAFFRAPAGLPLAFQALDARGLAVQTMRSLVYLQPGEILSCVGCHEHRTTAPAAGARPLAAARGPSDIAPGPEGSKPFSYPLLVQPVLDRHCVRCHNASKPEGKVVLSGEPQGQYTASYNALAPRVSFSAWGGKSGDFRQANSEPLSRPDFFGLRGSPALMKWLTNHYEVALPAADLERVATWVDANALFYGTFDPADQLRQQRGEWIAGPAIQ